MANLNISIAAEPIFHIGHVAITNSIFSSWLITIALIALSLWASKNIVYTKKPQGLQNVLELLIESLSDLTDGITGSIKKSKAIFPFVLSFFLFIILNNWFGLLPGVGTIGFHEEHEGHAVFVPFFRAGTSDINTTLALALVSCVFTWINGFRFLGLKGYLSKFKNPLEIISEFSRLISFTFRLFGNVFAGEVLITVMTSLVPVIIPCAFYGLEIFFGAIQAFVFSILTLAFMNLAMEAHGGDAHEAHA